MQSAMYELWLTVETPWGEIIQRRHGTYQRMGDAQETGDRLLLLYDWIKFFHVRRMMRSVLEIGDVKRELRDAMAICRKLGIPSSHLRSMAAVILWLEGDDRCDPRGYCRMAKAIPGSDPLRDKETASAEIARQSVLAGVVDQFFAEEHA